MNVRPRTAAPPRRPSGARLVLVLGLIVALGPTPIAWAGELPSAGSGLVLSAVPSRGVAPLLVDFSLSTPNGTAALAYSWSFGDGSYLNGSGNAYTAPSHTYTGVGTFDATVTAIFAAGPENATVPIVVLSPVLTAAVAASPTNGTAPLTVTFNGTPSGGSGTYLSYLWKFGDGGAGSGLNIRYTYVTPGRFTADLAVTDSKGASTTTAVNITVRAAASPGQNRSGGNGSNDGPASPGLLSYAPAVALGLLGVGVAVFAAAAAWVLLRRREIPPAAARAPERTTATVDAPTPVPIPTPPVGERTPASLPIAPAPEPSGLAASRRLAHQLLREMAARPKVTIGELPGAEWTQAGLAQSVGAGQSAISRVLRRFRVAGIVEVETTHVAGGNRRVRVYRLTPRGERLARALAEPHDAETPTDPVDPSTRA